VRAVIGPPSPPPARKKVGWIVIYIVAVLIVVGRIGGALTGGHGIFRGLIKLVPPTNAHAIGYNIESLVEDVIVIIAIIGMVKNKT